MTGQVSLRGCGFALAALVAVGLCLLLGAAPTVAARTVTGPTDGLSVTSIQTGRTVDVEIRLPRPNPHDDLVPGSITGRPLAGTQFTVRRVGGIDLTTEQGWAAARSLTVAAARRGPLGPAVTAVTDSSGVARLTGLPIGLYLVTSVAPGSRDYAPFPITLPTGGEGGWNYAPVVYAKPDSGGPGIILPPFPFPWPGSSDGVPGIGFPPGGTVGPGGSVGSDGPGGSSGPGAPSAPGIPGAPGGEATPDTGGPGGQAPPATDPDGATARGALALTGTSMGLIAGAGAVLVGVGLVIRHVARGKTG